VVLSEAVYGGVYRLSTQLLVHFGLEFSFVDTTDPAVVLGAMRPNTKMLYVETPTNPTLRITDIAGMRNWRTSGELLGGGQYVSDAVSAKADRTGRAYCGALDDEVHERAQRATGGAVILTRPEDAERIYFCRGRGSGTCADGLLSGFRAG